MRPATVALLLLLSGCPGTANEYYPTLQIISGHAVIVGAVAVSTIDPAIRKDISTEYSGYLEGGSEQLIYGEATVFGITGTVSGHIITAIPNQSYELELQGLPPDLWTVRADHGDPLHYTLIAINPTQLDIVGDANPESVCIQLSLEKPE